MYIICARKSYNNKKKKILVNSTVLSLKDIQRFGFVLHKPGSSSSSQSSKFKFHI